jgi:hypothetical protein
MSTEHLSHGHSGNGRPIHSDVSFEKTDVRTKAIIRFLIYLGILVVFSYLVVFWMYRGLDNYFVSTYPPPMPSQLEAAPNLPPEPRMQGMPGHLIDPQQDLRDKIKTDTAANDKLGWIDEKAGIAQIPVTDAMQLIVEKGLPPVTPSLADKK